MLFFLSFCRWALVESKKYYSKLELAQEKIINNYRQELFFNNL